MAVELFIALSLAFATESPPVVRKVTFEGVEAVSKGDLKGGLAHREPSGFLFFRKRTRLDRLALELDRRRIEAFYRLRGYFSTVVTDADVVPRDDGVEIVFVVDEGSPALLMEVDFVSPDELPISKAKLLKVVGLRVGRPIRYEAYEAGKRLIRTRFQRLGHAHARVEGVVELKRPGDESRVVYTIRPGPLVRFGELTVAGTSSIPESAVRNRVAYEEGEVFDPDLIELTEGRLYQLDLVGAVRTEWPPNEQPLPIRVSVSDRVPRELRLGGGLARDPVNWEVRLRGEYTQANFLHPLQRLRLTLQPSLTFQEDLNRLAPNVEATVSVLRDDFLLPRLQADFRLAYAINQLEAIQVQGPRFSVSLSRPFVRDRLIPRISGHVDGFFSVTFDDIDESTTEEERAGFGISSSIPLVYGRTGLTWDGRDVPTSPRSGFFAEVNFELGVELNDPGMYANMVPEVRGYVPLTSSTVGTMRVQFGTTLQGNLPATRRFFSGGAVSHRGFPNRRLAPSVLDDNGNIVPLGGNHEYEVNVELRQDLFQLFGNTFGVAFFVDLADVAVDLESLEFTNPHVAPGLGLRYATPIGPVRVDLGVRLNRLDDVRPVDGFIERLAVHLTIGEAF
ncbi:MAG: autotransporter assembly complex family protein [Myxococcota bacterium]